jgi:hypothetical protein
MRSWSNRTTERDRRCGPSALGEGDLAERLVREGRSRVLTEFNERRGVEAFAHAVESVLAD